MTEAAAWKQSENVIVKTSTTYHDILIYDGYLIQWGSGGKDSDGCQALPWVIEFTSMATGKVISTYISFRHSTRKGGKGGGILQKE